jgi:hypothetical protein
MKRLAAMALLLFLAAGCGEGGIGVSGTVKFSDGSPLTKGTVVFEGEMRSFRGILSDSGEFSLSDSSSVEGTVTPGEYKVYIVDAIEGAGGSVEPIGMDYDKEGNPTEEPESDEPKLLIAEKFTSAETSGLVATIPAPDGKNLEFKVEKP